MEVPRAGPVRRKMSSELEWSGPCPEQRDKKDLELRGYSLASTQICEDEGREKLHGQSR
jgi:hypothetical protein